MYGKESTYFNWGFVFYARWDLKIFWKEDIMWTKSSEFTIHKYSFFQLFWKKRRIFSFFFFFLFENYVAKHDFNKDISFTCVVKKVKM